MRHTVIRLSFAGLAIFASGCITTDPIETVDLVFADPKFQSKPAMSAAERPTFRAGDVYRYRVGEALVAETVERVDGDGVWWRDNLGRRWVGGEGALVPTRAVARPDGQPSPAEVRIESTGDMFPIDIGKTVAFRSTKPNWLHGSTRHERSCTVEDYGTLTIAAGTFDSFRIKCLYDGHLRYNYYAPAVGRVVLQTTDTLLDSVQRELIGFEPGKGAPLRTAEAAPAPKDPKPAKTAPAAKAKPVPAGLTAGSEIRYGIQLAAYRSPARIKKAWPWIKRRGGPLLAEFEPTVERHQSTRGPLFRLIVGDFATKNEARAHCRALKRGGVDCWPRERGGAPVRGPVAAGAPKDPFKMVSR